MDQHPDHRLVSPGTVTNDLQQVLLDALLKQATPEQASAALAQLERVVSGPAFVISADEDEAAASWLAGMSARLMAICAKK